VLNTTSVLGVLGKHAFTRFGKLKLTNWLAEQEETSRIVLYVADAQPGAPWTQRCIRQADAILVVGLGDDDPAVGEYEKLLNITTARKDLVLLHNERYVVQGSTAEWLTRRSWVNAHHHVQMHVPYRRLTSNTRNPTLLDDLSKLLRPSSIVNSRTAPTRPAFSRLKSFDNFESGFISAAAQADTQTNQTNQITSDFRRIARRLLAKTVALVLGGGGARGMAHVGMIKALEEAGIEFDMIGGTSQGAFIGGVLAREGNSLAVVARSRTFAAQMSSTLSYLMDLTYPGVAWFTGHSFNRTVWKTFSDSHIEDTWIPYFCTAVNVTWSRLDIERSGYLWRSIRASMSLLGLVPPMSSDGDMLIDGGYINNLPADVARALGANTIIAVDVGGVDDTSPVSYGDHVSGWTYLWDRWNPFKDKLYQRIPSMTELQSRLAYVSQVQQLEMAKQLEGVLWVDFGRAGVELRLILFPLNLSSYCHPPTAKYGILEFGKAEEIVAMGYDFGRSMIKRWHEDGTLASKFGILDKGMYMRRRRASHGITVRSGSRMEAELTPSPSTPGDSSSISSGRGTLKKGSTVLGSFLGGSSGLKDDEIKDEGAEVDKAQGFARSRRLSL
jgi:lysophospholipid hydrolase